VLQKVSFKTLIKKFYIIACLILFFSLTRQFMKHYNTRQSHVQTAKMSALASAPTSAPSITQLIEKEFEPEGPTIVAQAKSIAFCESTFRPDAKNPKSSAKGIFQILDSTWHRFCSDLDNPKDAFQNIQCAHRIYNYDSNSSGRGWKQWVCKAGNKDKLAEH
jgi:hypothetical protein